MGKQTGFHIGDKYGMLKIIAKAGVHKKPCGTTESMWLCKCDCGKEIIVLGHNLKSGNTKSCGCLSEKMKKSKKLPNSKGVINQIILQYKRHAKDRNLSWNLTYEQVETIIQQPCFYCGCEKSNHKVTKNCKNGFAYNGIDRIDNNVGYEIKNVVPCCKICNYAKSDMNQKNFILWAKKVAEHTKVMAEQWGGNAKGSDIG